LARIVTNFRAAASLYRRASTLCHLSAKRAGQDRSLTYGPDGRFVTFFIIESPASA
jgi:hypothetical protein